MNKILVIGQLPPPIHGSNIMTELLIDSLKNINKKVVLVQKNFSSTQEEIGKFRIKKIYEAVALVMRMVTAIIFKKPDLCILFNAVRSPAMYADVILVIFLKLFNIKTMLYIHGNGLTTNKKNHGLINRLAVKIMLSLSKGAFVLGDTMIGDINAYMPESNIFVLPNAIKGNCLDKDKKYNNTKLRVLFLSNLVPEKGPMIFLETAKLIKENNINAMFILAGEARNSDFDREIKNYLNENDLFDTVILPGKVVGNNKEELFLNSDLFVFPTYFEKEVAPLVILEAMKYGLPIIASDKGCISELIKDQINGYILKENNSNEICNKIQEIISDDENFNRMSIQSKKIFMDSFSISAYEKNLVNALDFALKL
jgi:glycosyltransferase involved in cell wall biosynthesis